MLPRSELLYFRDISRYRVLTDEEERVLVKAVQENKIGVLVEGPTEAKASLLGS